MATAETTNREAHKRGRYHVQEVKLGSAESREELQAVLDTGESKEWHLVGVAGGMPDGGVMLFWDTIRPSFGRSSRV